MKRSIIAVIALFTLSGTLYASTKVVNLPAPPEVCKLLADAECLFDAKSGKYIIVGDSSEVIYNTEDKIDTVSQKKFSEIKSSVLKSLNKKIDETTKQKECVLASDTLAELKKCDKLDNSTSNNSFLTTKKSIIASLNRDITQIKKDIEILKYSKIEEGLKNRKLNDLYKKLNQKRVLLNCLSEASNSKDIKQCKTKFDKDIIFQPITSNKQQKSTLKNFDFKKKITLSRLNKRVDSLKRRVERVANSNRFSKAYKSKQIERLKSIISSLEEQISCTLESSNFKELKECNKNRFHHYKMYSR